MAFQIALESSRAGFDLDPISAYRDALTRLYELHEWGNLWLTMESLATSVAAWAGPRAGRGDPRPSRRGRTTLPQRWPIAAPKPPPP